MSLTTKLAVCGWIRENYNGAFLNDISDIIHEFYSIKIDSKILTTNEQSELLNLLFDELKTKKGNENIKCIDTKVLFRASDHKFKSSDFHEICDKQGPPIVLYHNEYDHIFGGYAPKSWDVDKYTITAPTAFLWMIRPYGKVLRFHEEYSDGCNAIRNSIVHGPKFGLGADIWVTNDYMHNGCYPCSFDFDGEEMTGIDCDMSGEHVFELKDYEVFKIFLR